MPHTAERLQTVLDGHAKFFRNKNVALPQLRPYLVRWVREFLLFARDHPGYTFEQTLDLFLSDLGSRVGIEPWQVQQAADAVRIYRHQYRGASDESEEGRPPDGRGGEGVRGRARKAHSCACQANNEVSGR